MYVLGQRRNSGRKRKGSVPNLGLGICEDSAHPQDPAPRRRRTSTTTRSTTLNPDIQAAQGNPRVTDAPRTDAPPTDAPHPKSSECAVCGYYKPAGVRQCARCLSHLRSEHLSNINITKEHLNITKEHLCPPVQEASEVHTNTHRNTHRSAGVHSRHNADSFASFTVAGGGGWDGGQLETKAFSTLPSTWSDDTGLTDSSPNTAAPDLQAKILKSQYLGQLGYKIRLWL